MSVTQMKIPWIPLKDRKPRLGQRCIVVVRSGRVQDAYFYPHWEGGFCDGRGVGLAVHPVVKWMPYR